MVNPTPSTPRPVRVHTGRILQNAFSVAILLATLFTALSPKMFSNDWWKTALGFSQVSEAGVGLTPTPSQQKVGIVAGHWSDNGDPGARCSDGLTEQQVNYDIASRVRQGLVALGYQVDLLQEYDPRLEGYYASMLLSIHAPGSQPGRPPDGLPVR
jgi:N-acetylmuramoyl-L-alanine amidase